MNKTELSDKLLALNIFIENEYFEKYLELIVANTFTEAEKNITNRHHIIPKCYFEHNSILVDNSSSNKVNLKLTDHILAHFYLYKSADQDWFKYANLLAIQFCLNYGHRLEDITEDWITENLQKYETLLESRKELAKKLDIKLSGAGENNSFFGRHHTEESKKKMSISQKNQSELVRKHRSEAARGKKQSKETIEKRVVSLKIAHENSENNGYKDVGKKISETKKLNNSGNNLNDKIIIIHLDTGKKKYISKEQLAGYKKLGWAQQKIRCIETNLVFDRLDDASLQSGISKSEIRRVCNGERETVFGFHWEYFLDLEENNF